MSKYSTDRIAGLILFLFALGYTFQAAFFRSTMPTDPLGPSAFPTILGVVLALCSLWMMLKPDVNPAWPAAASWVKMLLIITSLILYAYLMRPLGFVLATTLVMSALAIIFKGSPLKAIVASIATAASLYFLFDFGLGLNLPNGILPF